VPSLQRACERAVARELVEPRSVCGVLLYADAAGATMLRRYCLVRSAQDVPFCFQKGPDAACQDRTLTRARCFFPGCATTAWCGNKTRAVAPASSRISPV